MPEHTVITQKQDANRRNAGRSHTRQSNFEMLRIVSMMLVLVLHADFLSLGIPKANDFYTDPTNAWTRTLFSWTRSWLKYHTRYCIEKNRYFIYPYYSFSTNCGEAGTHSARAQAHYQTVLQMAIEGPLRLPDTPAQAVCYDAFFENKALYDALGLTEETCCLDISGLRTPLEGQRFVLSTRSLPYKIVRSFGRMLRPVEMNVIENVPGNAIFLYDRLSPALRIRNARSDSFLYHYRINDMLSVMRGYGPGRLVRDAFSRLIGKITRN